jgi:hypothetical protein
MVHKRGRSRLHSLPAYIDPPLGYNTLSRISGSAVEENGRDLETLGRPSRQ